MRTFAALWIGHTASLTGGTVGYFALTLCVWQQTGRATAVALLPFFAYAAATLSAPWVGTYVDRCDRRRLLMAADFTTMMACGYVLAGALTGSLTVALTYVVVAVTAAAQTFKATAVAASVAPLVPRAHAGRAAGLLGMTDSGAGIVGPLVALGLLSRLGVGGALTCAVLGSAVSLLILLGLKLPSPAAPRGGAGHGVPLREIAATFHYMAARPGLLHLHVLSLGATALTVAWLSLLPALVLHKGTDDASALGLVLASGGMGGMAGGVGMLICGPRRHHVRTLLVAMVLSGAAGPCVIGWGSTTAIWSAGLIVASFGQAIANASALALWQSKVSVERQGRVFATQRLAACLAALVGAAVAGPLSDHLLGPALSTRAAGLAGLALACAGWAMGPLRNLEIRLQDDAWSARPPECLARAER